jgi:GNAT superfamily N-acetyltransferase
MEIRKVDLKDLERFAELFDEYRVFYGKPSDIEGAKAFLRERIIKNESEIFVSVSGQTLTGFTQLYPLFSSTRMKRVWLLNDLFVDEKFRGQGFSKALIERVKEFCRETEARGFSLETSKTNEVGNQLYLKMGLELDKEHNYYSWEVINSNQ